MQSRRLGLELERRILTNARGESGLETKRLRVRHMSRPKFFYLGLPNSVLKPMFFSICGLHIAYQSFFVVKKSFEIVCNLEVVF